MHPECLDGRLLGHQDRPAIVDPPEPDELSAGTFTVRTGPAGCAGPGSPAMTGRWFAGRLRRGVGAAAFAALVGACSIGDGLPAADADAAKLHEQAGAALTRWSAAVAAAGGSDFVPVGELVGQVGDWEAAVGDNNKPALMAAMLEAAVSLPADPPPDGQITWPDGSILEVPLLSATQALADIRSAGGGACPECRALLITDAQVTSGPMPTSRGLATVPLWAFTIQGTAVKATRLAVAGKVTVVPPPWDPNHAPVGISVDSAAGTAAGIELTVTFVGAPGPASEGCGVDYAAEAVESDKAIVVIVHEHRNPGLGGCTAIGATRTATVKLAAPLGSRTVLEIKEGLPVPLTLLP
jgi:hypothetical protein